MPRTRLYSEHPDKKQPAFNWGVGVTLSALNAAAKCEGKYKPWLREYADATRTYWNEIGYDVLPRPHGSDRYYDDNAWMALALLETHEILGDKKYLDWAKGALDFALRGESPEGGVFWRENNKESRHACSSLPTAVACVNVYSRTKNQFYLQEARRIVDWVRTSLVDPDDNLVWDHMNNGGICDKTKWSYNTGLMIRALRGLGLGGLQEVVKESRRHWLERGGIKDAARFAHLLLEAWVEVQGVAPEFVDVLRSVQKARSPNGFYPSNWGAGQRGGGGEILDQAAFARACFFLASH